MLRIDGAIPQEVKKDLRKNGKLKSTGSESKSFLGELEKREQEFQDFNVEMQELRCEIDEVGSVLDKAPTENNFRKFRDLIRTLLKKVSSEAYKIKKSRETHGKYEGYYQVVNTVNKELDELFRMILKDQKRNIEKTNKIMRLKGLVLDLLS